MVDVKRELAKIRDTLLKDGSLPAVEAIDQLLERLTPGPCNDYVHRDFKKGVYRFCPSCAASRPEKTLDAESLAKFKSHVRFIEDRVAEAEAEGKVTCVIDEPDESIFEAVAYWVLHEGFKEFSVYGHDICVEW